jgi:predicted ATPase
LVLAYLPETAVASYLAQRFGKQVLPEWFVRTLHQRTDGNPMFLVAVVDALVRQEMLTQGVTGWEFVGSGSEGDGYPREPAAIH